MRIAAFYANIREAARQSGLPVGAVLRELRGLGLESVYFSLSGELKPGGAELAELLDACGLRVEGLWDTLQFHEQTDAEAEASWREMVDCAARFGAEHLLITPGAFWPYENQAITREEVARREDDVVRMIRRMRQAAAYGAEKGVCVTLENYDVFTSPIVYPEVLERFFDEIPEMKMSFDTGNFVPCGRDVLEEFARYRSRIVTLHLKDRTEHPEPGSRETAPYRTEAGRLYYPAAVGSGEMHIPEIVRAMNDAGYAGAGIIELFGSTDMTAKLKQSILWMKANA